MFIVYVNLNNEKKITRLYCNLSKPIISIYFFLCGPKILEKILWVKKMYFKGQWSKMCTHSHKHLSTVNLLIKQIRLLKF